MHGRIYVAGPITDHPNYLHEFAKLVGVLRAQGHMVVSPTELLGQHEGMPYQGYLAATLPAVCWCEAVALLEGWEHSRGCRAEVGVAVELGKKIYFADDMARSGRAAMPLTIDHHLIVNGDGT